jgi:hypothetical protein
MPNPPRRRWFQFSLATMFVVVTLTAIPLGWTAYSLNWIRQRRAVLAEEKIHRNPHRRILGIWPTEWCRENSPGMLWLFGEPATELVQIVIPDVNNITEAQYKRLAQCERLFPEAEVELVQNMPWSPATPATAP